MHIFVNDAFSSFLLLIFSFNEDNILIPFYNFNGSFYSIDGGYVHDYNFKINYITLNDNKYCNLDIFNNYCDNVNIINPINNLPTTFITKIYFFNLFLKNYNLKYFGHFFNSNTINYFILFLQKVFLIFLKIPLSV